MSQKNISNKEIGQRINKIRTSLNLSQSLFAKSLGVTQGYISCIEKAEKDPSMTLLILITKQYNITKKWLITGEGEMIQERDVECDDPKISKLLKKVRKVLKSGHKVTQEALEVSIRYFSQAIDDLELLQETKKRQKNMESRMASLETRIKKSEDIRKEDPPERQEELLKLRTG
ncbi:MAG: helix-turn-helix transcriptional regulator [Thermodesulfobacteriota bacterium]|nr:helix-turn-helix transcriptional regulator [Thermodesulfobacteriota bacterium]